MNIWLLFIIQLVLAALSERAKELTQLALQLQDHIIQITNSDVSFVFNKKQSIRDYWTLVTVTSTDPKHKCSPCKGLDSVLSTVSRSWYHDYEDSHLLYFVNIDLVDESNIRLFKKLRLETVPHIWLFPPSTSLDEVQHTDVELLPRFIYNAPSENSVGQALQLAQFLSEKVQKSIVVRESNQMSSFVKMFALTLGAILLVKKKGPKAITRMQKKNGWEIVSILFVLVFTCGYSFAMIQGVPFIAQNDKGQPIYVSGGVHYQFGVEIIIVGLNYLFLGISLVSLIQLGKYKVTKSLRVASEGSKFFLVFINSVVVYLLYSCLTSLFLRKDHGYPYSFTKLF